MMELTAYIITALVNVAGLLGSLRLVKSYSAYRSHFYIFLYFVLSSCVDIISGQLLFTGHVTILPAPSMHKLVISFVLLAWVFRDMLYKGGND